MSKDRVYSWRVSSETLRAMEREASYEGTSLAELLDRVTARWLAQRTEERAGDAAEQARLRTAARRTLGAIEGGEPRRSARVREAVRRRLRARAR